jgi:hypothetical protein
LNKPGSHVMLFLLFTADRKAEVMESSTGGCNGKVCRNVYPLSSLLARGYRPVRYRVLENAPSAETKEPVSLRDQSKAGEDEKSNTGSKKLATAHSDDDDRPRVRHRRRHSSRN